MRIICIKVALFSSASAALGAWVDSIFVVSFLCLLPVAAVGLWPDAVERAVGALLYVKRSP